MRTPSEKFVEYFFRAVVIASAVLTGILLISAIIRLLDADASGLSQQP